jgi:hypothetical protein
MGTVLIFLFPYARSVQRTYCDNEMNHSRILRDLTRFEPPLNTKRRFLVSCLYAYSPHQGLILITFGIQGFIRHRLVDGEYKHSCYKIIGAIQRNAKNTKCFFSPKRL